MATVADVLRRARSLMQDETEPYRYPDVDLIDAINDGIERMVAVRPDLFPTVSFLPPAVVDPTDTLSISGPYIHPLVLFVVGTMMLREDEFATDGRAGALINRAGDLLTGEAK